MMQVQNAFKRFGCCILKTYLYTVERLSPMANLPLTLFKSLTKHINLFGYNDWGYRNQIL